MSTILLTENDQKITHPKGLKIKLKNHQLTSIYAMDKLEQTGKIDRNIKSSIYKFQIYSEDTRSYYYSWLPQNAKKFKDIKYTIETNFGILADVVGSGKTYMVMGLLNHNLVPPDHEKIISSSVYSMLRYKDDITALKTNLIIVPHNLVTQWKQAFATCPLKTYIVSRKSDINFLAYPENVFLEDPDKQKSNINPSEMSEKELDDLENISEINTIEYYDTIICSATMIDEYIEKFKDVKYSRIIIDEVCSIKLPADLNWKANFIWFITATPSGIMYLKRYYIKDIVGKMHKFIFDNIIIKNNDEYVSKSMSLPNINQILIKCFTPKQFAIVKEFIPNEVLDMLNAGNYQDAVLRLNCNVDTNENILQVLTNKIAKEIHNKKAELTYQENIIPTDKKSHDELVAKLKDKIKSLETKFDSISQRIKEFNKDNCPICLEEFANVAPGILPCCNQLFCLTCLTQIKSECPMCRVPFKMENVHIIMDNIVKKSNQKTKTNNEINKVDALIKLIKDKPTGRFLLFSNYDQTFDNINKKLVDNNITFSKVMGSGAVVNKIIERFTKGEVRVLMLNAVNYGSGLNLQMATDIIIYHQLSLELETQVIGRAQRMGRTEPLNVYYLLHEHEQNNVSNPTLSLDLTLDSDLIELDKHLNLYEESVNIPIDVDLNDIPAELLEDFEEEKPKKTTKTRKSKTTTNTTTEVKKTTRGRKKAVVADI